MESQAIRVSRSFEELRSVIEKLDARRVVVYQHDSDEEVSRTHIHILVQDCNVEKLTFKRRIEALVGKVAASDWSFKATDDNVGKYITYMSKGVLQPVYQRGYTDDEVAKFRASWVTHEKSKPDKKATYDVVIQKIIESCSFDDNDHITPASVKLVTDLLIKELNKHRMIVGRFKFRDMVDTVFRQVKPEAYASKMVNLYMERF